jgi:hypothetical protein
VVSRCYSFNGLLFCGQLQFDDDVMFTLFLLAFRWASGIYHGVQGTKGVQFELLNTHFDDAM